MKKRLNLYTYLLSGIFLVILIRIGGAQEKKLGDIRDGNRSPHVHVLNLYDEEGSLIDPDDRVPMPFSPRETCRECHNYRIISTGWHFNSVNQKSSPGRRGEPWIFIDPVSATQVPVSLHDWPGTFKPEKFGLSPFRFTEEFGRHMAGGGISENDSTESPDIYMRWMVSGKLEINCLCCHDGESAHDQAEYELQVWKQNYRWAAAATSGFVTVTGSAKDMPDNYDIYSGVVYDVQDAIPPTVEYDKSRFSNTNKITFDIVRDIPEERCYFCHSFKTVKENPAENWAPDKDVHLAKGLTCVDCHRNGLDHSMIRGYEWEAIYTGNSSVASFSCEGCHIRDEKSDSPNSGRLGAVVPSHKGLPKIHFDKLSCTACHSGPWPEKNVSRVKLSRAHALGTHDVKRGDDVVPYILSPVYVKDDDGKIAPHRLIWPSYWAFMTGDSIFPAEPETIRKITLSFVLKDSVTDSTNVAGIIEGNWPLFSETQILQVLDSLKTINPDKGIPAFISGGKVFRYADSTLLIEKNYTAAGPYTWAFAHDVRPAEQSLGIRGCSDCHSVDSPFSFGTAEAPVPLDFTEGSTIGMTSFQELDNIYPRIFALTFLFRPFLKYLIMFCCIIIMMVLLLYSLKGLEAILKKWSGTNS